MRELDAVESGIKKPEDDERDDGDEERRKEAEKKLPSIGESTGRPL